MTDLTSGTQQPQNLSKDECERMIALLQASGHFQVLRRFEPVDRYHDDDGSMKRVAAIIDTETTGTDPTKDKVIEIGYVLVEFSPESGKVFGILSRYNGLQDPGFPLPEKIIQITGLKDEDLKGQVFDSERIRSDIARADVVIAQNASFDRPFLETVFSEFAEKHWACGMQEGPWDDMGVGSKKQEFLAFKVAGVFYDAHRALTDAEVLLHILTCKAHDGNPILKHVLDKARATRYTIWANNSPYDKKDILKLERNYRYSGDTGLMPKTWYLENIVDVNEELAYLAANIYNGRGRVTLDKVTSKERYSSRYRERCLMDLSLIPADTSEPTPAPAPAPA